MVSGTWRGAVAAAILLWGACSAGAQSPTGWLQNGKLMKDNPAGAAAAGGFAVMQISTTDPDQLIAAWERPGAGARLASATTMARNQPIVTFILFRGCKADARGNCNVTVDFETADPNGKTYDSTRNAEVWVGRPGPPAQALQLSAGALGLRIEDKDPLGVYRVRATVTDQVSGVVLRTEQMLTATEK